MKMLLAILLIAFAGWAFGFGFRQGWDMAGAFGRWLSNKGKRP